MILTVWGRQGGSGRTTVATNLAIIRAHAGRKVALIDACRHGGATGFHQQRTERQPQAVGYAHFESAKNLSPVEKVLLAHEFQDIVIDLGDGDLNSERDWLHLSNTIAIPLLPSLENPWLQDAAETIWSINPHLRVCIFFNLADPKGGHQTYEIQKVKDGLTLAFYTRPLCRRQAVPAAEREGLGVVELSRPDELAAAEMRALCRFLFAEASAASQMPKLQKTGMP